MSKYDRAEDVARELKSELLRRHIVDAEDIPGFPDEDQTLIKITILVAACDSIVQSAKELNRKLDRKETEIWKNKQNMN